jgi:hypothetical protein
MNKLLMAILLPIAYIIALPFLIMCGEIMYWVYCAGTFPEQGGMAFTYGNFGTPNLEQSLDKMKAILVKDKAMILDKVKDKKNEA